ncbi:MAG: alpha/beta hydrolase [Dehalococcoidia bacterium]
MTTAVTVDDRVRELFFGYDPTTPLEPQTRVISEEGGVRTTHFVIASTHGQRVPGLIWRSVDAIGSAPVIILQHGASSKKEDDYIRLPAMRWARQGMTCVAIDANNHGERVTTPRDQQAQWTQPWTRRDHAIQMCNDLQRTVDYLETRAEADTSRLGYVGFSMGTTNGVSFVALDQRVKAAVFAVGGARLFELRPKPDDPELREEMETVAAIVDPVHFAPRIAPRPVLMVNGSRDETVIPEAGRALYDALGEPKRIVWFDGGHTNLSGREFKEFWAFLSTAL